MNDINTLLYHLFHPQEYKPMQYRNMLIDTIICPLGIFSVLCRDVFSPRK